MRVEVHPPAAVSIDMGLGTGDSDAGHRVIESGDVRALHAITVNGLQPSTRYSYSVRAGVASKLAAFTTAPRDDGDAPFRFLVYGDSRTDDAAHAAVVRAMVPVASDFVVHTGDFVDDGASPAQWQSFFDIEAPLLGARCVYSCVGNHELTDGAGIEYARFFGPTDLPPGVDSTRAKRAPARPEHFDGTFRWGNARFFLINGMVSFKSSVDRSWLEKALTDADAEPDLKWRVVVVHHGPWSSGPHGNNTRLHDAGIPALLRAHKVDLVISGHDHIYERGWVDGLAYLVSGGGGAPVYRVKAAAPQAKKLESVRHFVEMSVNGASMQLVATRVDGSTLERCSLSKNVKGWDCDALVGEAPPSPSNAHEPGTTSAAPPSRCACHVVGGAAGEGERAASVLVVLGLVLRRWRRSPRTS